MTASWTLLIATSIALTCGACSSRPLQGGLVPVAASAQGTSHVPVLVATTRRSTTDAGEMFNGERAEAASYAAVTVSIPPDNVREIGRVQWPDSVPGDPGKNFVTVSANHLDRSAFTASVTAAAKQTGKTRVLVFVHGFNNRFDEALYRFAQIVHDAKAEGIPVLFTWPSRGETRLNAYTYDRESANYSRDSLEQLLVMLAANPSVKEVNIVAHSMGNWLTLEALRGLSIRSGKIGHKIKNVFLVAPDVDVDVFRSQIRRMGSSRPRFAMFVSQDDSALRLSQAIWGGVPRIGEVNPTQDHYRSLLEQEQILVFDLTKLGGAAHSRAFDDITQVMVMVGERMNDGPQAVGRPGNGVARPR